MHGINVVNKQKDQCMTPEKCDFLCIGENTGPNPVEWCHKCGAWRDGEEVTLPDWRDRVGSNTSNEDHERNARIPDKPSS